MFPEPTAPAANRAAVFLGYLDYFRDRAIDKVRGMPAAERHTSRLASGWTPLELLNHVRHVERRWIEWRFEARPLPDPWADELDGRWHVAPTETLDSVVAALRTQAAHTRAVVERTDLSTLGAPGPDWPAAELSGEPPTLERVLFHLLQEYARHLGQLDIVSELADGPVGE
ncbi:MAG: DUF664 domain-containing protein [Actinophytocola sp.]|uniref:mycothiol transferase n=1 Tax=Actinophytocola sp. TaxID=1872138 RepID=UPI0013289A59|nr:DUF664 domain-containing protein [Actinophytocola sp.]MPZ80903.1 DUF664 domain-containing protein [Actinophytocola sp.]